MIRNLRKRILDWHLTRWVARQERGYNGIGKFSSAQDERVYLSSLDGGCEEFGDVQFGGHFTLVEDFEGHDWIVQEDSQGFVDVDRYDLGTLAQDAFHTTEIDYYSDDDDWDDELDDPAECPQCQSTDHWSVLACDLKREENLLDDMDPDA